MNHVVHECTEQKTGALNSAMNVRTISVESASAQRAGGLISDFMLQRIAGGWCVLLVETGRTDSLLAVQRKDLDAADESATTFRTSDEALAIIYQIGFDIARNAIGMWRPEPKHMERLQSRTMDVLKSVVDAPKNAT
ncbi:hypothetical protein G3O00_36025 [Burkholderia sp. Ac-20384]|uniref:hypothetical protein n=1 Tax=Burkholderia sp. Ac-20384 TaxID=2703902 RepID=UPI001980BA9D|nr:hypothetical protein [Burkholderia sp. Ac-20384]MBN3828973.1 hypothetical protein [Burkholderia sp. Ac-20384]